MAGKYNFIMSLSSGHKPYALHPIRNEEIIEIALTGMMSKSKIKLPTQL